MRVKMATSTGPPMFEEIIKLKKELPELQGYSLDEIIKYQRMRMDEIENSTIRPIIKEDSDDVHKSLDCLIKERKIPKAPKYGPRYGTSIKTKVPSSRSSLTSDSPPESSSSTQSSTIHAIPRNVFVSPEPTCSSSCSSSSSITESQTSPERVLSSSVVKIRMRKVDPMTHSLGEIIEVVDKKEEEPKKELPGTSKRPAPSPEPSTSKRGPFKTDNTLTRKEGKAPNGMHYIMTPYRALTLLSERGMIIELSIGKLVDGLEKGNRDRLWRCIILSSDIRGVCESERKVVAREMASHQFLQNLKDEFPSDFIPKYEVPEELFIDPRVFHLIEKKGTSVAHETRLLESRGNWRDGKVHPVYTYECKYFVEDKEFKGVSIEEKYAKLSAAKNAYEYISGRPYEPTKYFFEEDCNPKLEYVFNESIACQIIGNEDYINM